MANIHAGKAEGFFVGKTIHAGKGEFFQLKSTIDAGKQETFTMTAIVASGAGERFALRNESIAAYQQGTVVEGKEYLKYFPPIVVPQVTLTSSAGTENMTPAVKKWLIRKHLDGKDMLELTLVQPGYSLADLNNPTDSGTHGYLNKFVKLQPDSINPFYVGFADPNARLIRHNYTSRTYWSISLEYGYDQTGYAKWDFSPMLPLEPTFDGTVLTIKGEDFCGLLERQNCSMADIDMDAPPETRVNKTSHQAITEIISTYGNFASVVIQFKPYQIRLMRRKNGVPLTWLDQILRIRQAKRRVRGRTLYLGAPTPPHLGSPKWTFKEGFHITAGSFRVRQDLGDYKNEYSVSRTSPQGGIIGEQECRGPQCVGRTGNISFDMPVTACAAQVQVTNGVLEDFVYKRGDTPVLADPIYALGPSGTTYLGPVTDRVEFTYRASVGAGSFVQGVGGGIGYNAVFGQTTSGLVGYTPGYKVVYYGKLDSNIGQSPVYNYTAKDTTQQTLFGKWLEYGDIEDPMIADAATLYDYGQALLREGTRKVWTLEFDTVWVNPEVEPGDIIAIDDYQCKMTGVNWLVEEVTIQGENNSATMTILATRGGV